MVSVHELEIGDKITDEHGTLFTVTEKHRGYTLVHRDSDGMPGVLRGDILYQKIQRPAQNARE